MRLDPLLVAVFDTLVRFVLVTGWAVVACGFWLMTSEILNARRAR